MVLLSAGRLECKEVAKLYGSDLLATLGVGVGQAALPQWESWAGEAGWESVSQKDKITLPFILIPCWQKKVRWW